MKEHILDANALFRFLTDGAGAEIVAGVFKRALATAGVVAMSAVNWGEAFYALARVHGFDGTREIMARMSAVPLTVVPVDRSSAEAAARLKATYGLPYADCFAAALAHSHAVVVTAATKDFRRIPGLQILPLPAHKPAR